MTAKKVLVAGATGYLGSHVVRELHARGYAVRALARKPDKARRLDLPCDEIFVGEATEVETLSGVCDGIDVVISSLGIRSLDRHPTVEEVDYGANMNILSEAKKSGVEHFIFVSVLKGEELRSQNRVMDARERVCDALKASGLRYTIARPSGFFNDMEGIFDMARSGRFALIGKGDILLNPIHGADLAHELVNSIEQQERWNTAFDIGGPDVLTMKEIGYMAFTALGKSPSYVSIPAWLIGTAGFVAQPFNMNAASMLQTIATMGAITDLSAPRYGSHHLYEFYMELAQKDAH